MLGGDDRITGNNFGNTLSGDLGSDYIDGGAGTDTAYYIGFRSEYSITRTGPGNFTVANRSEGTDTLVNIERFKFIDQAVAYDTGGAAGQAWRLYQAAFNRAPDSAGLGFQMHTLDAGATLSQVAANFIASPEFASRYGSLDNTAFVTRLYANVLHRTPDATGLAYHLASLDHGLSRADVLAGFSESPENQAALIGTISNGMVYSG